MQHPAVEFQFTYKRLEMSSTKQLFFFLLNYRVKLFRLLSLLNSFEIVVVVLCLAEIRKRILIKKFCFTFFFLIKFVAEQKKIFVCKLWVGFCINLMEMLINEIYISTYILRKIQLTTKSRWGWSSLKWGKVFTSRRSVTKKEAL